MPPIVRAGSRRRKTMSVPVVPSGKERRFRSSKAHRDALLPGIPNEITMTKIVPKLSWRDFYILPLVSTTWREAIRSRQVYDERVRHHRTDTLILVKYFVPSESIFWIALYSMKEDSTHKLPPVPPLVARFHPGWTWALTDGKIYVMDDSAHVYVFDVAGQRRWEQCAAMPVRKHSFGCGVLDGKIYLVNGFRGFHPVCGPEVYNPKDNTWSLVKPMPLLPCPQRVKMTGNKLSVHGGVVNDPGNLVMARSLEI